MEIKDQILILENKETKEQKKFTLPEVVFPSVVRAWIVPRNYREDGFFISVLPITEPVEIPACNISDCIYLGMKTVFPSEKTKMQVAKEAKILEIKKSCDTAVKKLAESYPDCEIQSWPQQVKEAEALSADPQFVAPLLTAIAEARGLSVTELASRVLSKMNAYAAASGTLIGHRQMIESLIDLAETVEDINRISWQVVQQ